MSQIETQMELVQNCLPSFSSASVLTLDIESTEDGFTILTPESEQELIAFLNTKCNGEIYCPRTEYQQPTNLTKQSHQFQQALAVSATMNTHGLEHGTYSDMLHEIHTSRAQLAKAQQATTKAAEDLTEIIGQLSSDTRFQDLIKTIAQTDVESLDELTEKVVSAVAPMIEELRLENENIKLATTADQIQPPFDVLENEEHVAASTTLDEAIDPEHLGEIELAEAEIGTQIVTGSKPAPRGGDRTQTRRNNR